MTGAPRDRWKHVLAKVLRWTTPVVALVLIGLTYFMGVRTERTGFVREVLDPGLKRITQPVLNAFRGGPPEVTKLWLTVDSSGFDTLRSTLARAEAAGWLAVDASPRVPAKLQVDGRLRDVLLQLKDGALEHPTRKNWPLHVRLPGGDTLRTLQTFDLVPVTDGGPLRTWLFQRILADQGLPAPRSTFVDVWLNEEELSLYTMHGLLDSTWLALHGLGQAPVVWFDDALLMTAREDMEERTFPSERPQQGDWVGAPVMTLHTPDAARAPHQQRAVRALEAFQAGAAPTSEVFDVRALARTFALGDLFGAQESLGWWDLRFVADSTGKLLAVPVRATCGEPISAITVLSSPTPVRFPSAGSGFRERLFSDAAFFRSYIAYLDTFSAQGWLEAVFTRIDGELGAQEKIVVGEFPQARLDRTVFAHDRTVVRQTLRPKDLVLAYVDERRGSDRLAIANVHGLPVEVSAVVAGGDTIALAKPQVLWPRERDKPLSYSILQVDVPADAPRPLHVLVNVLGLQEQRSALVRTWSTFPAN